MQQAGKDTVFQNICVLTTDFGGTPQFSFKTLKNACMGIKENMVIWEKMRVGLTQERMTEGRSLD